MVCETVTESIKGTTTLRSGAATSTLIFLNTYFTAYQIRDIFKIKKIKIWFLFALGTWNIINIFFSF